MVGTGRARHLGGRWGLVHRPKRQRGNSADTACVRRCSTARERASMVGTVPGRGRCRHRTSTRRAQCRVRTRRRVDRDHHRLAPLGTSTTSRSPESRPVQRRHPRVVRRIHPPILHTGTRWPGARLRRTRRRGDRTRRSSAESDRPYCRVLRTCTSLSTAATAGTNSNCPEFDPWESCSSPPAVVLWRPME